MVTIFAIDRGKYKSVAGLDQVGPSPAVGLRLLGVRVGPAYVGRYRVRCGHVMG
jgi:hypothetical protein